MNNIDKEVTMLPPFKRLCMTIGELPSSYLESMTYYESLLWFTRYLKDTVIPAINGNAEAVKELQDKYIELKQYVDDYFDNLNIQTEIDNKLDDMAEKGELVSIIATFLGTNAIIGFDTKSDLKGAENLADGVITKTIGEISYNDGKGNYYKIRELVEGDVIDDDLLLELTNYPSLVAEKLPDYRMNQVESAIDTLNNTTIPGIEEEISNLADKKWIFIGDSYSQGYTPDGSVTGWSTLLKNKMGLTSSNCLIADHGGAGFANTSYPYSQILNDLTADEDVTDILIAGGYNDTYYPASEITTGIGNCMTIIGTKFPNAKVHIGFIGGTTNQYHSSILKTIALYNDQCVNLGIDYMPNLQYILFDIRFLSSDGIHPNSSGETAIANGLYQALHGGYNYYIDRELTLDMSNTDYFTTSSPIVFRLRSNNECSVLSSNGANLTPTAGFEIHNNEFINIGRIPKYGVMGSYSYSTLFAIGNVIVHSTTAPAGYYNMSAQLFISNAGDVYIKLMPSASTDNLGYQTFGNCNNLQISYISISYMTDVM